jgi:hypothetical protein
VSKQPHARNIGFIVRKTQKKWTGRDWLKMKKTSENDVNLRKLARKRRHLRQLGLPLRTNRDRELRAVAPSQPQAAAGADAAPHPQKTAAGVAATLQPQHGPSGNYEGSSYSLRSETGEALRAGLLYELARLAAIMPRFALGAVLAARRVADAARLPHGGRRVVHRADLQRSGSET